ncbi:thiamine-phosphate kinase [Acetobacter sp.]|jgi:thiamine-monophosphate kinase|uniref:thiamine-phosphate kinase n=1 Tax=Acetobacter sp. TaxID=440 RepID=UPI0025B895DE|nr:thiamine-phosphate kinase [Acetobacter sp.]MCH4090884.1 thiamine-phosphate kinase [Acetobacter sp.]MCI1301032.1 thiamine-phosphate kinase [Acetobacter sp.]MCI1317356.1 thiamine-phosphate kinase [Acetobacter sp.]
MTDRPDPTSPTDSLSHTLPDEFSFIRRHFRRLAGRDALDLTDDAAVFTPPSGKQLVIAADAMVEGVHFLPDDPPDTIGRKLLRANLSDMAAMGARPFGWLLTLACPKADGRYNDAWFEAFSDGLAEDQALFGVSLLGGDTTSTRGPLVLSLTILGDVSPSHALRRNGAQNGDGLWVTGTIGDGALGLLALQNRVADSTGWLTKRYRLPQPRLGLDLSGIAHAVMDVSDGLVQDIGHLARESGLGARLNVDSVPLSDAARTVVADDDGLALCLTGGDDYELLLAVPDDQTPALLSRCRAQGVAVTRIGDFVSAQKGVQVLRHDGSPFPLRRQGWSHF